MQERGRVRVMATQVADPVAEAAAQADNTKKLEAHDEKAAGPLETVSVGLLLGAALVLLALFRRRMPV
jgi:hypothetical protein